MYRFVRSYEVPSYEGAYKGLPRMQELRDQGALEMKTVPLTSAFQRSDFIKTIAFVSHRCVCACVHHHRRDRPTCRCQQGV